MRRFLCTAPVALASRHTAARSSGRQGALQGGIGSMNSIAVALGPLLASQSLAWSARQGFDGAAPWLRC